MSNVSISDVLIEFLGTLNKYIFISAKSQGKFDERKKTKRA